MVQGLVGVLLRVDDPDQQVDELDQAVHLEPVGELVGVVVRHVEQDQAVQLRLPVGVQDGLTPVRWRGTRASRAGVGGAVAPDARLGRPVVGRRTPVSASSIPAKALNRLDLPLPVAPTSATMVCRVPAGAARRSAR